MTALKLPFFHEAIFHLEQNFRFKKVDPNEIQVLFY